MDTNDGLYCLTYLPNIGSIALLNLKLFYNQKSQSVHFWKSVDQ